MINYDVKFITCDESVHLQNCDDKSFKYETKKRSEENALDSGKRDFSERRGGLWRAPRPRQLKQLEAKFRDKTVIKSVWTADSLVTVVFSSGVIAYLIVKINTLDITQILFDKYFVGKLSGQTVTNVALCKSHLLFTHSDRTATLVTFGKNNVNKVPCRISDRDPTLHSIELGGGTRRTERHLSSCDTATGSRILVWSVTAVEPAPWSPVVEDLANLHLYQVSGHNISLVAYHQLENETLSAELSHKQDNIIHIVEQTSCQKNGVSIEWFRYEIPSANRATKLSSKESGTRVSLPAPARIMRRSPCDTRLLVACIDGSLHVIHQVAGLTHSTKAGFIPTDVQWVDELIVAAEECGRLQCFDRALSLLHHHTKCFDLTAYLRDSRSMQILGTQAARGGPVILALFVNGPLALLRVTHPRILTAWIRARRMSNAVSLLKAMDWELEGTECLWAVNKLVCAALRSGAETVGEEVSAQAALGAFLAPRAPLAAAAAARYAPPLHDLARKFFHHLLRRGRIEKALSLAVDLAGWDLFCDARWAAERRGQRSLAEEASSLAAHYSRETPESECSDSCSDCSSHSYSNSETSASSEMNKTKPPPLPRVSLPHTLLPVPLSQPEPISTNSIRPNLHQYLERDNTIWNTETRENTYKPELRPILTQNANAKWHENGLPTFKTKREQNKTVIDIIPRPNESDSARFKHVFQTELREDASNTLYRYHDSYSTVRDRSYRNGGSDRQGVRTEKNKVKFSDTVTIAVVSDPCSVPVPSRELADSLPLSPPHRYLAAFAPHVTHATHATHATHTTHVTHATHVTPGTTHDYVEV